MIVLAVLFALIIGCFIGWALAPTETIHGPYLCAKCGAEAESGDTYTTLPDAGVIEKKAGEA